MIASDNNMTDSKQNIDKKQLLEFLNDAEEDVKNGRVEPIEDTFDSLREMLING